MARARGGRTPPHGRTADEVGFSEGAADRRGLARQWVRPCSAGAARPVRGARVLDQKITFTYAPTAVLSCATDI